MNPKVYPINGVNYNYETELFLILIIGKICFFLTNDFGYYCYLNKEDFQNLLSNMIKLYQINKKNYWRNISYTRRMKLFLQKKQSFHIEIVNIIHCEELVYIFL